MKKATDIFKKIAFAIATVMLYFVYVLDRLLTAPFPMEQPKPANWNVNKIKLSLIRVVTVCIVVVLWRIHWAITLICIFALITAVSIVEWRKVKKIGK